MKLQRILAFSLLATVVVVLTACESAKKVISRSKDAPDEFVVYQRPPLSLPPEFSLLSLIHI